MKKTTALILILCMVAFAFTCGCKKNPSETSDDVIKQANETLNIHCYQFSSLNPLECTNATNIQVFRLVFESLMQCDATQKAQPQLAESYKISQDALTWTFKLKKDVKWHDGSKLTANDVLYSYNFVMENTDKSIYSTNIRNIEEVKVISGDTVAFRLKTPQANFANLMEIPIIKAQDNFIPTGTGPYVYKETKNKIIYLSANENWHGGNPKIKNINVKILPDEETAVYAYISKEIDVVSINSSEQLDDYTSNSDNILLDYPSNRFTFIGINTNAEPLSNRLFRKAIAHAIDKEAINSEVLLSHGSVANTCMNSKWWVYNPGVTTYTHSVDKALNVLNDVKKNMKLTPITLMVNDDNGDKEKVAEMIKKNLKACGIDLRIEYVSWSTFNERVYTGNYEMYLGTVQYSSEINPQYILLTPSYDLQKLFASLQQQTSEDGIRTKYFEIQEKIAVEINIIPLYFDISSVMYNKRIEGTPFPNRINIFNGIQNIDLTA